MWCRAVWLLSLFLACSGLPTLSLTEWFDSNEVPKDLSITQNLARANLEAIEKVQAGRPIVIVLPTDKAWKREQKLLDRVRSDPTVVETLLLGIGGAVDPGVTDLQSLSAWAKQQSNVIDTGLGDMIVLQSNNKLCSAAYNSDTGNITPIKNKCTTIDPKRIYHARNALILLTDKIILTTSDFS